ncbi:MAG: NBR1-Ig-like domain-containing protein [Anaerolineales bacterium]
MQSKILPLFSMMILLILAACTRAEDQPASLPEERPTAVATQSQRPAVEEKAASADCVDGARFLEDLTLPDGSQVAPGGTIDKRWSVENSGSCDWGVGYRLIPQEGNPLVRSRETALYPARAGATAIWRVTFQAPEEPGEYIGSWQAYTPKGQPFGDPVFVLIEVDAEADGNAPSTSEASP